MILYFVFPSLATFAAFYNRVGFSDAQGWNFSLATQEIGGPVSVTVASPMVCGFPPNLGDLAVEAEGLFTGWRFVPCMN